VDWNWFGSGRYTKLVKENKNFFYLLRIYLKRNYKNREKGKAIYFEKFWVEIGVHEVLKKSTEALYVGVCLLTNVFFKFLKGTWEVSYPSLISVHGSTKIII
jgi:hypothetical protein